MAHMRPGRTVAGMANRKSDYVVFIEQTYNNGVVFAEVRASDSSEALDEACEEVGIDPMRTSKFIRNWWVVKGKLC